MNNRKRTLQRIQTKKLDKIKLQDCSYGDMDETHLKLHGHSECRRNLALKVLRSRAVSLTQVVAIGLYLLVLAAGFIFQDVWYGDRSSKDEKIASGLYVTELVLLGIFLIEILLHIVGYGTLYLREARSVCDLLFTLACSALTAFMFTQEDRRQDLLGVKTIAVVTLLYVRLETFKIKWTALRYPKDLQKVSPDDPSFIQDTLQHSHHLGVVSVRNKVIEELRAVQDRINHDARADVALEYCIKMIITNQLNEQDFELS